MNLSDEQIIEGLGKKMRAIRKERGMTQLDVASKSGMEENAYRRVELAGTSPTLKTILRIARALDTDLIELFNFSRIEKP